MKMAKRLGLFIIGGRRVRVQKKERAEVRVRGTEPCEGSDEK
jgi:hypothetical protein